MVTLLAAEVGLRVAGVKLDGSTYQADRELGWSLRPGSEGWQTREGVAWTRINSHGFRDRERAVQKPPGAYRIAVVGDSITEARHVEMDQTYTARLERALAACPSFEGRQVEVLNFAVPGYGTAQQLLLLDRVWPFEPDLVLLAFFARNDLFNNVRRLNTSSPGVPPYFMLEGGRLVLDDSFLTQPELSPFRMRLKSAWDWALPRSRVLLLLYQARVTFNRRRAAEQPERRSQREPGVPEDYASFWFYLPPRHPAMVEAWAVTEALLRRFAEEVRAHGARLAAALFPADIQIHPDEGVRRRLTSEHGVEDFEYADRRVAQIAEGLGADAFILAPEMRKRAVSQQVYFTGFANTQLGAGHYNAAGHAVVARLLAKALCEASGPGSSR